MDFHNISQETIPTLDYEVIVMSGIYFVSRNKRQGN